MRRFAALQTLLMVAGPLASRGAYAQDPLQDWDPGVSSSSSSFEILQPTELAVVPHSQALWVSLRTGNTHAYPFPGEQSMMTVEVEKGVDVQSGVLVGDVPGPNKPYITKWQSVKVFSVPVYENCDWLGTNPYSQVAPHSCKFQVPGYLSAEKLRVGQHQAGFYRIRAVVTGFGSSAWRMFRVPGVFQDVKAPLSFPSKAELTCAIFLPDEEWGVMSPYPDGSKVDIKDESRDIHYFVENKALGVAKDFTVRRSLTRQSDRVRIGQRRRMNAKTETLSLEGKVGTSSPKVGFTFHEQVQLAVGETAVVRGWMAVDSENAVDETNETNNSCSYQITIHRVE